MIRPYTIDTSVFISALDQDDPKVAASQKFLKYVHDSSKEVVIPTVVLIEVLNVLRRRLQHRDAAFVKKTYQNLVNAPNVIVVPVDMAYVETIFSLPASAQLKSNDLMIAMCAFACKSILVSWDKTFLKQAKKFVNVSDPEELI